MNLVLNASVMKYTTSCDELEYYIIRAHYICTIVRVQTVYLKWICGVSPNLCTNRVC